MVAAAGGPELHRRDAGREERARVGGAVAADRERLALEGAADAVAQREHVGFVRETIAGSRVKTLRISTSSSARIWLEDRARVLPGQVADVHVDPAPVGHLVEGVAALDAARG